MTVQSSWRPQLPLPKELQLSNENISELQQPPQEPSHPYQQLQLQQQQHQQKQNNFYPHQQQQYDVNDLDEIQIIESDMDRFHMSSKKDPSLNGSQLSNASHNNNSNSKKWSFGRFFRRNKKEIESESSSEDDRKAGFSPAHKYPRSSSAATSTPNKKSKSKAAANSSAANRNSRAGGFDHIVVSPISGNSSSTVTSPVIGHIDNEFFLPVETVSPMGSQEPFYQNQTQRLHHSQQYLSHAPQTQQQLLSKSAHSLDRRASRAKQRSAAMAAGHSPQVVPGSSSEEELISLNSSTFSKYRSDESIHSGGQGHNGSGMSRKSRAARNERYYKRLSRDGEVSHGQVPVMLAQQPTQRWKTQPVPLSIYQPPSTARQHPEPQLRSSVDNASISKLRNTSSLQHMAPYVQWNPQQLQQRAQQQQPSKNLQNSVNEAKRSISYDSHIHLQNINGRMQTKPLPPPPPPRDPLRRVNVGSGHLQEGSSSDLRPISYAFDQTGVPVLPASGLSGRCVSDDKIWAQHQPQYQSIRSLNISANQGNQSGVQPQNRRFITRADRDAHPGKKSLPNGLDFHYVADATPRSRKPIHMLEAGNKTAPYGDEGEEQPPSSGILRTTKSGLPTSPTKVNATEFWKRMDGSSQNLVTPTPAPRGRDVQRSSVDSTAGINMKPRSVSSSRLSEMRAYPMPMYSEVYKPNKTKTSPQPRAASPHPHQGQDEVDGVVCGSLRIKPAQDNSSSNYVEIRNKDMPKSHSMPDHYHRRSGELSVAPNKYEEYVNERREQHQNAPQPPQRKLVGVPNIPQLSFPRKKPANLEEAINELEAIYRSLGLTEPEATETVPGPITKKDRVPTPNDFEKYALAHADEYDDDDDSPTGEPDPIRDDVAYRNIKLANLQHKTVEKQPPFGIPIGPIVPASQTDYLHVKPNNQVEFLKKDTKAPDVIKDDLAVRALRKDPLQPKERFQYPSSVLPKKNRATRTQSANIYALIQRDAAKPSGGDLYSYMELTKSIDRSGSMSDLHKKGQEADDIPSTLKLLQSLKEQENEQNTVAVCSKKSHIPFRHPSQGGAICQLPQKLSTGAEEKKTLVVQHQKPTPKPRKSLTPEPQQGETNKMEEALNKIAQDAQESSIKLSQELQELRKEALITQSKPKRQDSHDDKFEQDLQEIEKVSQAAKKCGKLLLETLPDSDEVAPNEKAPRKLHKEDKLIQAIDQVSEAANKVCEKILKDIVTTEPPVVVQEAVQVKQTQQQQPPSPAVNPSKKDTTSSLVIPTLIKKLDPIQSDKIEAIARRCMRQLSDLADNHDYDNLNQPEISVASTCNLEASNSNKVQSPNDLSTSTLTETPKAFVASKPQEPMIEDIDQIMRECEDQARKQEMAKTTSTTTASATTRAASSSHGPLTKVPPPPAGCSATASSISSSSDCLAKSSSPTASRRFSSSITSFNPYSSSDYIKSPSSEYHAPSTDRIKSCSTTSYDVQSTTSATPNITTTNSVASNFSCSPSPPPLNLTPVSNCSATLACSSSQRARSSSPSQYNSSEELAMIFGIEDKSGANRMPRTSKLQKHSESAIDSSVNDLSSESATAKTSCQLQQQNPQPLQLQHPQSEQQQQSLLKKQQNFKRYQGHHPHFHHHTAPAYYTDLHLRIHTPEVKDSLNENYQSVYRTPSKLVKDERQFPKTATAVVPPAIIQTPRSPTPKSPREVTSTEQQEGNSTTSTASFFRGAGSGLPREEQQPRSANDPYGSSSPSLANPAKGNSPHDHLPPAVANADGSVVFACTNFKPCKATDFAPQPTGSPRQSPAAGGRSSRNPQRFSNRRRAVRVRSESRPISALYDIICKEKGLDIGSSTSNDEDFSAPNSHDERNATRSRRSHSRSLSKQTKAASSCNVMMSPGGEASQSRGGMVGQKKRQTKDKRSSSSIFINDLSDNEDDDGSLLHHAEDGEHSALHHHQHHQKRHLLMGDAQMKSSSLPPGLKSLSDYSLNIENHNNKNNHHQHTQHPHQHPSSKVSQDSLKTLQTSSASDNVLNANYSSLSSSAKPIPPSVAGAGAGTSTAAAAAAAAMVSSPKAERSSRKYRRSRDEKPRRHTDGAVHIMAAEQMDDQQEQPQQYPHHSHHHHPQSLPPAPMSLQYDDHDDADHTHRHHHQHRHHHKHQHHHQPEQFPASELQHSHHHHHQQHDLNGAGHDFHVSANAANAKRFITRSQRATSAGIINGGGGGGGQPCDSSTSACNSPIQSGRLSPTLSSSIAPTTRASPSSSLQQQQQQPDIPPHLSKSPTAAGAAVHLGKTENGFAAAIGGVNDDMTNNSGRGVSVKPPPVTKTPGVAEDNNSINTIAATTTTTPTTTTKIKKKSNALDLMNSQIPLSDENKASKTKAEATPPATTGSVSNSNPSNQTGLNTVAVVATTPAVISVATGCPPANTITSSNPIDDNTVCPNVSMEIHIRQPQHHHQYHNHHHHQQQQQQQEPLPCNTAAADVAQKSSNKIGQITSSQHHYNNFYHSNCLNGGNSNYATPTTSSVLKQRKQPGNSNLPKLRKCPLSPLLISAAKMPITIHAKTPTTPITPPSTISINSNTTTTTTTTATKTPTPPTTTIANDLQYLNEGKQIPPINSPLNVVTGSSCSSSVCSSSLTTTPLSPNNNCPLSVHLVRTTKTTRLRAAALDKKKGEVNHQNHQHQPQPQHFTSPTSPNKQRSSISADKATPSGSEGEQNGRQMPNSCSPTNRSKKLVPSMSVSSVKQNLNEMHCTAATKATSPRSVNTNSPKSPKNKISNSATTSVECTVKVPSSPKSSPKQSAMNRQSAPPNLQVDDIDDDFMEIHDLPMDDGPMLRPRCSTMQNEAKEKRRSGSNNEAPLELSPVHRSRNSDRSPRRPEERDKSSKRKSNLNRSQNEEPIQDSDEAAARRRKRRELGMARTLVPADDAGAAVKELLTSPSKAQPGSPPKPSSRNDLSYHMELARRGLDQASNANAMANRRRAQTASPKHVKESSSPPSGSSNSKAAGPVLQKVSRRCDTVAIGELRKQRTDEVNRKLNERTRSDLAEIIKIAEIANDCSESAANAISDLTKTMNRLRTSQERDAATEEANRCSPGKHTTFHQEERIYYEPDPLEHIDQNGSELQERSKLGGILRSQRMLKARSIERESSFEPPKLSPILRRKSTDDPLSNAPHQSGNQIVSILKKKDHLSACESSSASSNASPVTFSANVMDTPSKQKRAGILKKRSSLDESRYYSRSHSPDERSIFIKSARRNSLEETAANGNMSGNCSLTQGPHGILKQSSYDSFKSDSCPSAGGAVGGGSSGESQHPHSILKKKDSTSTPSDLAQHATKHVSISQAVILAAAELSANETAENVTFGDDVSFTPSNEEYDIKPILKLETSTTEDSVRQPKPILKKKSSGDSDEHEIKPILKTSRKSSREEFEFDPFSESDSTSHGEPLVKPILKTDSPSKRRSLGPTDDDPDAERESATSPFMLKRRTRSLERQDHTPVIDLGAALNAIATSQENTDDLVASLTSSTPGANVSVADRIKSMEKFLTNQNAATAGSNSAINTSWESPLQNDPNKSEDVATAGGMAAAGAGAVKILKPSVIRRDLLKDRYKTQPVTSDEKNFFKSNDSSTLYTSPAGSAFKPAKSLEGLGFINITAHGNQSPNAPPSAFALTRSYTQPLQPLKHSLSNAAVVTSTSTPPPTAGQASTSFKARKTPTRNDSTTNQSDLTHSFTGDSGLSCDSNSEQRIFEMSGLEQDVDMIENQEPKTPSNTADVSSGGSSSGSGIVRTNSVRARANMFQQLQEKTNNGSNNGLNREERTSPRRVPRRLSPSPAANADEPRTPNNPPLNPDEEIASSSTVATATSSAFEPPRGILKSKSSVIGGVGLMPSALSNELKNRLKSSQNASVSNLRKSATTSDAVRELQPSTNISASTTSAAFPMTSSGLVASSSNQHDDTVSLVRNLTNLGKPPQLRDPMKTEPDIASASEGESSGGREVSEIIKNSAVARRRKFNEGNFLPKSKSHSSIVVPPPGGVAIGIGPQLPPLTGAIKLRHVGSTGDATKPDSLNSSLPPQLPSLSQFPKQQPQPSSSASASQDLPEEQFRQPTALPPFLQGGLRRSSTQVMGPDQRSLTITKTGSIADRLAALQKSGEDDWKRRISKRDEIDDIKRENFVNESISLAHDISDKPLAPSPFIKTAIEGGKVSDRLGKLKSSSESWKTRVEQSDASKFTVAGRLQKKAQSPVELQFERSANAAAKKCPLHVIRSANQPLLGLAKSPSMMTTGSGRTPGVGVGHHLVQRSLSINEGNVIAERSSSSNSDSDNEKDNKNKQNGNSKDVLSITVGGITSSHGAGTGGARVAIPKLDDEETFEKFFALKKSPTTPVTPEDESINIEDFDHIKSTQRLAVKRNIQLPKGRRAARNPLRNLASRTDLSSEYTEVKSGIAEREMRRIRAESYGGRANLAAEAIAGLASVEDFKSVSLKSSSLPLVQMWVPYKPVMLLHVKGRTHVQTRLVEPSYLSLNRGDCFILVNGPNLYRYVGSYANIIEISRSKKICAYIVENKDMGCTATSEVILTDGKFMNEHHWKKFWEILGKPEDYIIPDSGHADEDDLFEASLIETNKVYEFQDDSLVPFEKYWGCIPKVEMLDSKKVLVFDFGSEMYIWNGKNAPSDFKRAALKLAQEHYDDALVDYSKCYVNPMQYASIVGARDNYSFPKRCDKRGDWCILGKITQNMETSLFKEKFADWPEVERGDLEKDYLTNGVNSVKPLDGNALFKGNPYEEPNLVLEQANLGRGNFYYDTNSMRHFEIISKTCDKWQINEFNFDKVDSESYGHFYTAESYIIKWIYQINVTVRELSGRISNRSTVGRDRCVYFTWQGSEATANEKGAAALLTVELDKEKGAQMRVAQGDETTVFIRLFGVMCQHKGRREESLARRSQWRLYQVIGNVPEETLLKEVDCHGKQLRSRSSMLMIHGEKGIIYVWHGCQSAAHTRDVCQKAAEKLKDLKPKDLFESDSSVTIEVMEETKEVEDFKEILSGDFTQPAQLYGSLCDETAKFYNYTPRLFHFSSTQGVFSASELLSPLRCQDLITPYPFAQAQLYNARQPTIFMLDDGDSVWLWMGWWPLEDIKINTDERSSPTNENRAGVNRWISERRAALETAVSYWKAKFGENNEKQFHGIKGYVVWAGLEPIAFKALFPDWSDRDDIKDINLQDGRTNEPLPIADVLEQLLQTEYPLEVLKARPLPEGVDPTRLELYLNTDDFEKALGLQRSEFEQMPLWKQTNLKKERGLF
ncbi:pneumococcal serine-rich repeat protein isoform X3 [Musca domestica]|uniref:Uncharacterized protein LOC101899622 isoform X4 n=1 Tax=Musca domestica TaxID=7370 RepID=A0A1I8NA84_MUSDO|nr:pneumococcal serine-rich repeat protein isoform X3 [Musca domestica]